MSRFHRWFELRLVLLSMTALVSVIAIIHVVVYIMARNVIEEQIKMGAQGLAAAVANHVMENIEDYKSFMETKDVNSDYYRKMQAYFASLKAESNIRFIYTERKIDEITIEFLLDAEPIGSDDYSAPGERNKNDPQREKVYSEKHTAGFKLTHYPEWGWLLGAYSPIFDHDGEMLGIAGVNVDASLLHDYLNRLQMVLFSIYAVIVGMASLILMKYIKVILEPLFKDKLTGAYTKRYSEKLIQEEIIVAVKERKDLALLMLDLDHFKRINDTYGHEFGDKVLSSTSEIIRQSLRQKDYFIRYGGEEFIVIVPSINKKNAKEIAERIRRAIEESEIFNEEQGIPIKVTISIGIANLAHSASALSVTDFIDQADKALYAAKKSRNCVSVFGQDLDTAAEVMFS